MRNLWVDVRKLLLSFPVRALLLPSTQLSDQYERFKKRLQLDAFEASFNDIKTVPTVLLAHSRTR